MKDLLKKMDDTAEDMKDFLHIYVPITDYAKDMATLIRHVNALEDRIENNGSGMSKVPSKANLNTRDGDSSVHSVPSETTKTGKGKGSK